MGDNPENRVAYSDGPRVLVDVGPSKFWREASEMGEACLLPAPRAQVVVRSADAMKSHLRRYLRSADPRDPRGVRANGVVRVMVGAVFLSEGIQKFLYPEALGVGRFAKIGIPMPSFSAPFVGGVEIVAGALLLLGLATRLAAILLLVDISVAIATTKVPMLASKGFWATVHEARTDWCMWLGLAFLLMAGPGSRSLDARILRRYSAG